MTSSRELNPYDNKLNDNEDKAKKIDNYSFKFNHIRHNYSINISNPVDDVESNLITLSSIYSYRQSYFC